MIRVFIGYDPNEIIAYHVLAQSILETASQPVSITPIKNSTLPIFDRDRNELQSTEFSFSRFLVPYLCDYDGFAIFLDCDMLVTHDISNLWEYRGGLTSASVVKHDYEPSTNVKFLGAKQTKYEKKNWSSVILFNNSRCHALTPEYVNSASGLELHQFKWTEESLIGSLPEEWGYLVGEEPIPKKLPKLIHWTLGGPYFKGSEHALYANQWLDMMRKTVSATDPSVYIK